MNINLQTAINFLGYGQVGTQFLSALSELGNDIALFPLNPQTMEANPKHHDLIRKSSINAQFFDRLAPCIRIWHQWEMATFVGKGKHIGFPIFELDNLTPLERHQLNSLDEIFVCSEWAKQVCKANDINPEVRVIPLGVDLEIFKPMPRFMWNKFVFINVGKWEYRKGHDVLIECFNQAFKENDNVELWMINDNPLRPAEENNSWRSQYTGSPLGKKVKIIDRVPSQEELALLMSNADCGIFPARAEGWNLEVLELMSLGVPSIVTSYSGHTQFCSAKNSYPIDITEEEDAVDGIWFKPGQPVNQGRWAKINENAKEQIINHMRNVFKNRPPIEIRQECLATAKEFTWINAAKKICSYL